MAAASNLFSVPVRRSMQITKTTHILVAQNKSLHVLLHCTSFAVGLSFYSLPIMESQSKPNKGVSYE